MPTYPIPGAYPVSKPQYVPSIDEKLMEMPPAGPAPAMVSEKRAGPFLTQPIGVFSNLNSGDRAIFLGSTTNEPASTDTNVAQAAQSLPLPPNKKPNGMRPGNAIPPPIAHQIKLVKSQLPPAVHDSALAFGNRSRFAFTSGSFGWTRAYARMRSICARWAVSIVDSSPACFSAALPTSAISGGKFDWSRC